MVKATTADKLTLVFYSGTSGLEDYKAISSLYEALSLEKPLSLLEIALDRHEAVYDSDLPPQLKIFLTAPDASSGGQLTPSSTIEVFEYNRRKFYHLKNLILEHARRIRAKEIRVISLFTSVGGTGFTAALRFALLLKSELNGIMPITISFFPTVPPMDISQRPSGMQDALKIGNTDFALRELVAVSPSIELACIRFPRELGLSERRIGYLLRALGLLPIEGVEQDNPFQIEQLMAISTEKCYPLVLSASVLIRFPKSQLEQRELLVNGLEKFQKNHSMLNEELRELQEKSEVSSSPLEEATHDLLERIGGMSGVRSRRWKNFLLEAQEKVESAKEMVSKATVEGKEAMDDIEHSDEQLKSFQLLIKKIESLQAQLDEELARGHYKAGLYVLRVSPQEREKLGPFSAIERLPLRTIMAKLGREKELYDLIQEQVEQPVASLLQQLIGIKLPKDAISLDELKVVSSSSVNISHLMAPQGVQLVGDTVFQDEVAIVILCMVELEPMDNSKTFEWVKKNLETIEKWNVPLAKRLSIRSIKSEGKSPEQMISEIKLRGRGKDDQGKPIVEVDSA